MLDHRLHYLKIFKPFVLVWGLLFLILAGLFLSTSPAYAASSMVIDLNYIPRGEEANYPRAKLSDGSTFNYSKIVISGNARGYSGPVPLIIYLHGNGACSGRICQTVSDPRIAATMGGIVIRPVNLFQTILDTDQFWAGKKPANLPPVIIAVPASTGESETLFPGLKFQDLIKAVQNDLANNRETTNVKIATVSVAGHSGIGCNERVWRDEMATIYPHAILYADTCFRNFDYNHHPKGLIAINSGLMQGSWDSFLKNKEMKQVKKSDFRKDYNGGYDYAAQHEELNYYGIFAGDKNHGTPITYGMVFMLKHLMEGAESGSALSDVELKEELDCGDGELIVPDQGVKIPGLTYSQKGTVITCGDGKCLEIPHLAQYIAAFYKYIIGISLLAAAVMIIYAGFIYILSSTGIQIKEAKQKIVDALMGLVIFLGAYIILANINPNLITPATLRISCIKSNKFVSDDAIPIALQGEKVSLTADVQDQYGNDMTWPKRICESVEECKKYCSGTPVPLESEGMAKKEDMEVIPYFPGIKRKNNTQLLRPDAIEALKVAAQAAWTWPGGPYELFINSAYRPLQYQIDLACRDINSASNPGSGLTSGAIAWPGSSLHGIGVAVDVSLMKDGKLITQCCSVSRQTTDNKQGDVELLQEIMSSVGWVRYCHEVWHFEWGTGEVRGRSKKCSWPPP